MHATIGVNLALSMKRVTNVQIIHIEIKIKIVLVLMDTLTTEAQALVKNVTINVIHVLVLISVLNVQRILLEI